MQTYREIALVGRIHISGNAMAQNPTVFIVPCYRVTAFDGSHSRFTPDLQIKTDLLKISAQLSEKLEDETAAHELLKDSYEANMKNWMADEECNETIIHNQEE